MLQVKENSFVGKKRKKNKRRLSCKKQRESKHCKTKMLNKSKLKRIDSQGMMSEGNRKLFQKRERLGTDNSRIIVGSAEKS